MDQDRYHTPGGLTSLWTIFNTRLSTPKIGDNTFVFNSISFGLFLIFVLNWASGVAMFAPMGNPYDSSMTKEERHRTWEKWTAKRKMMHVLARRFPSLLPYFYSRSFLSGIQGRIEKWLSLSLGKKVTIPTPVPMDTVLLLTHLETKLYYQLIYFHIPSLVSYCFLHVYIFYYWYDGRNARMSGGHNWKLQALTNQ